MRIDRSEEADDPGDAHMGRRARSTPDDPDVAGKDIQKAVRGDGLLDSSLARPDPVTRVERAVVQQAKVKAVYEQYAIDHGYTGPDKLERETATPVTRRTEAEDPELPEGYTSSPALKGDPYHADSVAARSGANRELYAATSRDRAEALGYTTRIPAQKAPFNSHGQEVFTNGKNYITPDVDGHNTTDGWKMFSRRGVRIGTYDSELNYFKE